MPALCKLSNVSARNTQDKEHVHTVDDKNKLRDEILEEPEQRNSCGRSGRSPDSAKAI